MGTTIEQPQRLSWTDSELYRVLSDTFPEMRTSQQKVLDIVKLSEEIQLSRECIYKWLRAGRILSRRGVEKIVEVANRPEYREALARHGRTPPTKQDLARFLIF